MVYIPTELVFQPPKKAGVSLYVTKKTASKSAKVRFQKIPPKIDVQLILTFIFQTAEEDSVEDENDQGEDDSRKRAASSEPETTDEPASKVAATENNGGVEGASGRPKRATRK